MGFGRGALLWLIGAPIPVIILLALFGTTDHIGGPHAGPPTVGRRPRPCGEVPRHGSSHRFRGEIRIVGHERGEHAVGPAEPDLQRVFAAAADRAPASGGRATSYFSASTPRAA